MQWLEVKIKTLKKTASLSEKGCWCWLAFWEITDKVSCDVDGLEYHLQYQTYHLWMKGLSTDREDNIFFHMFSLQKKNLIETGKSKPKQKNKHYGFFFISPCHPVRSPTTREREIPKIKKEKAPQTNLPAKKKDPNHQTLPPKTQFCCWQPRDGSGGASQWSQMPNK